MAKLIDLFLPEASVLDMKARTMNEALRELAVAFAGAMADIDADELYELLLHSESFQPSALGGGMATPNLLLSQLQRSRFAIGRSRSGIDCDAIDGVPVHLFWFCVYAETDPAGRGHAVETIVQAIVNANLREKLLSANSIAAVVRIFEEEDQ